MKIGAENLVLKWGRPMQLKRDGVVLLSFKGRLAEVRPGSEEYDQSVDQHNYKIIGGVSEFGTVRPQKFDVVVYDGQEYTVQRSHVAGADEDELIKMMVRGGLV